MTSKEVEQALGISRANVRYYEKEGLLFPKRNPVNDYRDYSKADIETLRRILFLRNLDIPVETIRQLSQKKLDLKEVIFAQQKTLEQGMQERGEQYHALCTLCESIREQEVDFASFVPIEGELAKEEEEKMIRWDKIIVCGFYLLQIFYTISIFPLLPSRIPTDWVGTTASEYHEKWYLLFYVVLTPFCIYAIRIILYYSCLPFLWRYMDEINAIAAVGLIGLTTSIELYTVLFLGGVTVTLVQFLFGYAMLYVVLLVVLIFLYRRKNHLLQM